MKPPALLDIISALIGLVMPMFKTWAVLRKRRPTLLVPWMKFWIVTGLFLGADIIMKGSRIEEVVPGYALLKLIGTIGIYLLHEDIYHKIIAPYFGKHEGSISRFAQNLPTRMMGLVSSAVNAVNDPNLQRRRSRNTRRNLAASSVDLTEESEGEGENDNAISVE